MPLQCFLSLELHTVDIWAIRCLGIVIFLLSVSFTHTSNRFSPEAVMVKEVCKVLTGTGALCCVVGVVPSQFVPLPPALPVGSAFPAHLSGCDI
jgi:hypothetical protein